MSSTEVLSAADPIQVRHFIRGRLDDAADVVRPAPDGLEFVMPRVNPDDLVWTRGQGFPAADVSLDEVLDFLVATGESLRRDDQGYIADALERISHVNPLGGGQMRRQMDAALSLFDRELMYAEYHQAFGDAPEGWVHVDGPRGIEFERRWVPSRLVHVMAGNTPHAGPQAIIRTALVRGVAVMKLPSNDPFTTIAVLQAMRDLDPDHPLIQCFSAVYWRGGDPEIESVIFRPQYVDKVVAWGGEGAIRNVVKYLGPGLELISFDPKTSISVIDQGAFESAETLKDAADRAAMDVRYQEGCATSRHQFVAGSVEQVDSYCEALLQALHDFHARVQGTGKSTPREVADEVEGLRMLEPDFRVWGVADGSGLIVRSSEPVDFYPDGRTVNVIRVDDLADVVGFVTEATQTVGVYPPSSKGGVRDALVLAGVDRVGDLGYSSPGPTGGMGGPHDGMIPLQRFVRWIYSAI